MSVVKCRMLVHSNSPHLSQLYTGFSLLERMGEIGLSQEFHKRNDGLYTSPKMHAHLSVIIDDDVRVHYDTSDGCEINESLLGEADFYFKRSYLPRAIPEEARNKVFPLGLNYAVYPAGLEFPEMARVLRLETVSKKVKVLGRLLAGRINIEKGQWFRPTIKNIRMAPNCSQKPRILFMAAAWEPSRDKGANKRKNEDRERITVMRARCIETLRREFGSLFLGGFSHSEYSRKYFRNALLDDASLKKKGTYISLMKQHPICVATTGLHGSIGWKLAEYVACSKAILAERLNYLVPCGFSNGNNYLEFDGPQSCAENADKLLTDHELRCRLMGNNNRYYDEFLYPGKLVARTIDIALKRSEATTHGQAGYRDFPSTIESN